MLRHALIALLILIVVSFVHGAESRSSESAKPLLDAECGAHEHYVKVCYDIRHLNPTNPSSQRLSADITAFLRANDEDDAGIVVAALTEAESGKYAEQRAYNVERAVRTAQRRVIQDTGRAERPVGPVMVDGALPQDSRQAYVFVMTETSLTKLQAELPEQERSETDRLVIGPTGRMALALSVEGGLERRSVIMWETMRDSAAPEIARLIERIKRDKHIAVVALYSAEPWPLDNETALQERVVAQVQANELGMTEDDIVNAPCTVYLLVDREGSQLRSTGELRAGAHLYQSRHCALRPDATAVARADPGEEAVVLLESAIRHTRPVTPEQLMAAALGSLRKGDLDQAQRLADYAAMTFKPNKHLIANARIIEAHRKLVTPGDDRQSLRDAATILEHVLPNATHPWQGYGALVAIRAAGVEENCGQVQRFYERYRDALRASREDGYAREILDRCYVAQLERTRETIHGDDSFTDLAILFVNDGMPEDDFQRLSEELTERLLALDGLSSHREQITVHTVSSTARISQSTSDRPPPRPPRIDPRTLHQAMRLQSADAVLVVSDEYYYPLQYASSGAVTGFVSTSVCGYDQSLPGGLGCVNRHVARILGMGLFDLEEEIDTVTAPLEKSLIETRMLERYSLEQQARIGEYFSTYHAPLGGRA